MILTKCSSRVPVWTFWRRYCAKQLVKCCAALAMAIITAHPARAVELVSSHPLWKDVAAFPRVAGENSVARQINETLTKADERLARAVRECAKPSSRPHELAGAWKRSVRVTTRGPTFVSLVADDVSFCGGAHPDSGTLALVFDLQTGKLVDWRTLLPVVLATSTTLDGSLDGGKVGLVGSDELSRIYQKLYPARPQDGMSKEDWASCREAVGEAQAFLMWPAVTPHGLALQPADLPHVVAACGVVVVVPTATLRGMGASQQLVDALNAGQ